MPRYKVGVVFGGHSTEHEVSILTGLQVVRFLSSHHDVIPIYITRDGAWLTGSKLTSLDTFRKFDPDDPQVHPAVITPDRQKQGLISPATKGIFGRARNVELDVVFPALHGLNGEDGSIQGLLELCDIPFVGCGVLASSIAIDKLTTKAVLRENGLPVLDYFQLYLSDWEQDSELITKAIKSRFPFPVIVKPSRLGSSIAVKKADDEDELQLAIDDAIHFDYRLLIEPFIKDRVEINCSVLGSTPPATSVCEQPISHDELLSYKDKYLHAQTERGMEGAARLVPAQISAALTAEVQNLSIKAFRSIGGQGVVRVDFLYDPAAARLYVNELNTMPGSIAYYLWKPCGIPPEELVDKLIDLAFEAHKARNRLTYTIATPLLQISDVLSLKG